ncbi:MAG: 8-amino-7-oxononanoate synthase [Phycisphaeraceae bacterium]|nr:8-amino-7-oxononanoate synthase [Phycisphaeraceae bacterium]
MSHWLDQLQQALDRRHSQDMLRTLRVSEPAGPLLIRDGRQLTNLTSNDYLGLSTEPALIEAVREAAGRYGVGSGASRLLGGHHVFHLNLERRFSAFKKTEAALLLPTGYMANLATLTALAGPDDLIVMDKLNHASLIDAARASGATVRTYPHGNLSKLRRLLEGAGRYGRRLIVTDSVFSMDGDCADLPALCELRDRHEAILVVDDAHGTGVLGASGSGLAEHQQVAGSIDVTVCTASKALGSLGGIVCGPAVVIQTLINQARPLIYSTAVPPTQVAAIEAALDLIADQPQRRTKLAALGMILRQRLKHAGWSVRMDPTPIVPVEVTTAAAALELSDRLAEAGFEVPAVRPPSVPRGGSRLRISLRSDLDESEVVRLAETIGKP